MSVLQVVPLEPNASSSPHLISSAFPWDRVSSLLLPRCPPGRRARGGGGAAGGGHRRVGADRGQGGRQGAGRTGGQELGNRKSGACTRVQLGHNALCPCAHVVVAPLVPVWVCFHLRYPAANHLYYGSCLRPRSRRPSPLRCPAGCSPRRWRWWRCARGTSRAARARRTLRG